LITGCRWISRKDVWRFYGIHHLPRLKGRENTLLLVNALAVKNRRVENTGVHERPEGNGIKKNPTKL